MKTKYVTAEDPAGIIHLLDTSYLDYWIGLNLKVETLHRLHFIQNAAASHLL